MSETYIYGNTGDVNTQIGTNTLTSITTGVNNTAFGDTVFANLTTGSGNSGFGTNVGSAIGGNPTNTTAFGFETLKNMTTPANVSALGYQALMNLTTGNNNTGMGSGVGSNITSAADNTLFGYGADVVNSSTINATSVGQNSKSSSNSTVIGYNAQSLSTSATAYNVIIGTDTVADAASIQSIIFGNNAAVGTTINSVLMGYQAAGGSIGNMIDSSVILGWSAAENIQDSFEDVIIGPEAARNVDFSQRNVLVGVGANKTPVPATTGGSPLEYVVALGYEAGIQNSAPGNTFVGSGCGTNITNQTEITAIGVSALKYVEGSFNTAVGRRAMLGVDTVSIGAVNNVAVGEDALCSITTGFDNVVFGTRAGMSLTTGSNNVIMGHEADVGAAVTDSVVMGAGASATADNSVVIGEGAAQGFGAGPAHDDRDRAGNGADGGVDCDDDQRPRVWDRDDVSHPWSDPHLDGAIVVRGDGDHDYLRAERLAGRCECEPVRGFPKLGGDRAGREHRHHGDGVAGGAGRKHQREAGGTGAFFVQCDRGALVSGLVLSVHGPGVEGG